MHRLRGSNFCLWSNSGLGLRLDFSGFAMDFRKKRIQFMLFVLGVIALSIAGEKCRQLVGEQRSSQSGKFTFLNCFDMGSGTLACTVKEGVKMYFYNMRSALVEKKRHQAIETALVEALSQGLDAQNAAKQAQKEGARAAKLTARQARRITGPIVSSGWDFFEALYYGGTVTEGFLRGSGTLIGAYAGGMFGELCGLGRLGYLVGSLLGSWGGGRIGLMVYDVVNGVTYLLQFAQPEELQFAQPEDSQTIGFSAYQRSMAHDAADASGEYEAAEGSYGYESSAYEEL